MESCAAHCCIYDQYHLLENHTQCLHYAGMMHQCLHKLKENMLVWTVHANQQHVCNQTMSQTSLHRGKMQLDTGNHQHKYLKVLANVMVENLSGHLSIHLGLLLIFSVGSYN